MRPTVIHSDNVGGKSLTDLYTNSEGLIYIHHGRMFLFAIFTFPLTLTCVKYCSSSIYLYLVSFKKLDADLS